MHRSVLASEDPHTRTSGGISGEYRRRAPIERDLSIYRGSEAGDRRAMAQDCTRSCSGRTGLELRGRFEGKRRSSGETVPHPDHAQ